MRETPDPQEATDRKLFWTIVRVWSSRAAAIGAIVGAVSAFVIVFGSFRLDPPGLDPDAETLGAQLRLAGALALSGLYVGAMVGLLLGFLHGLLTASVTMRGWLSLHDRKAHCRGVRIIGAAVIAGTLIVGYGIAAGLGAAGGPDTWLLAASAAAGGLIAAVLTPSIVRRYESGTPL